MKIVDNFELIKDLLIFENEDVFYFLKIIQRRKDNPSLSTNSKSIKTYYIRSIDDFVKKYDEIKSICNLFNARACLWINKRSFHKVCLKNLENIVNILSNKSYENTISSYDRSCMMSNNEKNKKWIVDVDDDILIWSDLIISSINNCHPIENKIIKILPTKTGKHLITKPFNKIQFKELLKIELKKYQLNDINIDIHKDSPINLYIS